MTDLIPEKYREDEEIIRLTVEQIRKDLGTWCPEFRFSGQKNAIFDELAVQIADTLKLIRKSNPSVLKVILYQVDLKESLVPSASGRDSYFILAEKVIQREFQKVLTRRFFSGGTK